MFFRLILCAVLPFLKFCKDDDDSTEITDLGNDPSNPAIPATESPSAFRAPTKAPTTQSKAPTLPPTPFSYVFDCPPIGASMEFSLQRQDVVTLMTVSSGLCTLSLENENEGTYIPVSRSYDGHGWERSGGQFAAAMSEWNCNNAGSCTNLLPVRIDGKYVLRSHDIATSEMAEKARFLEAASFGPTRTSVAELSAAEDYVRKQIEIPMSSLREYFRRNANPVWEVHRPNFAASLNPCTVNSTFRRQVFSEKDVGKIMAVTKVGDRWKITVDGHVRSMPLQLRFENARNSHNDEIENGMSYKLCSGQPIELRRGLYRVETKEGKCRNLMADDVMAIDFPPDYVPDVALTGTLPSLTNNKDWISLSKFVSDYRYIKRIPASQCNQQTTYSVDGAPIFAKTADGEWMIFDPRLITRDNSLQNPMEDGGYEDFQAGRTTSCANTPRTYINEHSCVMTSKVACSPIHFGGDVQASDPGSIVCGSPDEVGNDFTVKDSWLDMKSTGGGTTGLPEETTSASIFRRQKEFIWTEIVLNSDDQLRQRIAWALSQIFALPATDVTGAAADTEKFLMYHDIFVRNAFGNYGDILKEITYNAPMAESLSFMYSRSLAKNFLRGGVLEYPDENFARELMQLFTIGLVKLNVDGTPLLDASNKQISTYDSDDVITFARFWTGFEPNGGGRANIEGVNDRNHIDPMTIEPEHRDRFPKSDLSGGYVGDGYPTCEGLPQDHFLVEGAKYRILGVSPKPDLIADDDSWATSLAAKRLELTSDSELYDELCASSSNGECTYPSVVVLSRHLKCFGIECEVDTVRIVKVGSVFYEYVRTACVFGAYFKDPRTVTLSTRRSERMCAPSSLPVAGEACCDIDNYRTNGTVACNYAGERMTFASASARCSALGKQLCHYRVLVDSEQCPKTGYHRWTADSCQQQVKVDSRGYAAIVHSVTINGGTITPSRFVQDNSPSFFKAYWEADGFPDPATSCDGLCTLVDNACLCDVDVTDSAVFFVLPATKEEIFSLLKIGHAPPSQYDDKFRSNSGNGFKYHTTGEGCCGIDTVFEVKDHNGITRFLQNKISSVTIKGSSYTFRNAPQFNSMIPSEYTVADAQHETDAVLNYLLHHENTSPFVALRLIQRFGVSNPSPRYVEAVATAFRFGHYDSNGISFGTGVYGDLTSTIAAVLLDREVRSASATHDPTYGSLREPIIKVIAFMRAAEFQSSLPLVELHDMQEKIGQMAFQQQSVFSFFRPEYRPSGAVSTATMVAPEAEVMASGKVIGFMNGLFDLARHGLRECDSGFGAFEDCDDEPGGSITYDGSIDELSMLLTGGRLSGAKRAAIAQAINQTNAEAALHESIQLLATTPEFHSTNKPAPRTQGVGVGVQSSEQQTDPGYKVVIHLGFEGGCDSFNLLSPHPACALSQEYKAARGLVALTDDELLELNGDTNGQPCSKFGLHHKLPFLKTLYDSGDLSFLANTGVLTEHVNINNYKGRTLTQLFAHNSMSEELGRLDPREETVGTGSLGRMVDVLERKGYRTGRVSIESSTLNLASRSVAASSVVTVDTGGVSPLTIDPPSLDTTVEILNGGLSGSESGLYGEAWSDILRKSRNQTAELYSLLGNAQTQTNFVDTRVGKRLAIASNLIANREGRGVDRDFFYVPLTGFDTHSNIAERLNGRFDEINAALENFVTELKLLGVWDNAVIVQSSEFGRTLTPNNGGGTDHAWGGNYWIAGGGVKGNRIVGQYPTTLDPEKSIGRGRIIPTTPWDSVFNAIGEWMGLQSAEELTSALPNRNSFPSLFGANDLFN